MQTDSVEARAVAVGRSGVVVGTLVGCAGVAVVCLLGTAALVVVLTVVFYPLFYIFPGVDGRLRDAVPWTVFAAVGWALLGTGVRVYAGIAGQFEGYGVLGVVLLGATLDAVLAEHAHETTNTKREPGDTSDDTRL
ncbi:hypothetical protein BRC79_08455 [Halobacteriales archaeon QH_8_67_27]|nr:MAG: hypothetical protein BRC79_08455 [Halobacteriales archaeon QH_8_67_27]